MEFIYFFSPNLESYWVGFYDFILHEIFPRKVNDFKVFSENCCDFYKNVYHIIPYEDICFISERPAEMMIDIRGRLHNEKDASIKFRDGYEIFCLNGVNVQEWLIKLPKEELNPEKIMEISNVEQRLQAIKYYGLDKMCQKLQTKVLDKYTFKPNQNVLKKYLPKKEFERDLWRNKEIDYELVMLNLEGKNCEFLKMVNPSTLEIHLEGIKPGITTVKEALAWRNGDSVYEQPKILT